MRNFYLDIILLYHSYEVTDDKSEGQPNCRGTIEAVGGGCTYFVVTARSRPPRMLCSQAGWTQPFAEALQRGSVFFRELQETVEPHTIPAGTRLDTHGSATGSESDLMVVKNVLSSMTR